MSWQKSVNVNRLFSSLIVLSDATIVCQPGVGWVSKSAFSMPPPSPPPPPSPAPPPAGIFSCTQWYFHPCYTSHPGITCCQCYWWWSTAVVVTVCGDAEDARNDTLVKFKREVCQISNSQAGSTCVLHSLLWFGMECVKRGLGVLHSLLWWPLLCNDMLTHWHHLPCVSENVDATTFHVIVSKVRSSLKNFCPNVEARQF